MAEESAVRGRTEGERRRSAGMKGLRIILDSHEALLAVIIIASVIVLALVSPNFATWPNISGMLLGLSVHALGYYPLVAWLVGGKSPRRYLGQGADAIITGLSCNSSLATVPITLRCLDRMGVSRRSARMAACGLREEDIHAVFTEKEAASKEAGKVMDAYRAYQAKIGGGRR